MRRRRQTAEERTGVRLRMTCKTRGWTLSKLAARASISRGTLYRFLEGRKVSCRTSIAVSHAAFAMLNETQEVVKEEVVWWKTNQVNA